MPKITDGMKQFMRGKAAFVATVGADGYTKVQFRFHSLSPANLRAITYQARATGQRVLTQRRARE